MTGAGRADPRALGVALAALGFAADQASKLWLLRGFDLPERSPVAVAPGVDFVMAWNRGVSYSLLTSDTEAGRWLLVAVTLAASAALAVWLWRSATALACAALGLLIGGALGNLVDRVAYGAVVDFVSLHAGHFRWYVFNVADCAITAGVVLLLLDWLAPDRRAEASGAARAGAARAGADRAATADAPKSPRSSQHS